MVSFILPFNSAFVYIGYFSMELRGDGKNSINPSQDFNLDFKLLLSGLKLWSYHKIKAQSVQ